MKIGREIYIPPMSAKALIIRKGETMRIIDVEGRQAGDFVAFNANDLSEKFSQARTRIENHKFKITEGDSLWTNTIPPRVMFTVTKDTCGTNDLLYVPCCRYALELRFGVSRDGCHENLARSLEPWNIAETELPDPLNIFFNVEVDQRGEIKIGEQISRPGDHIDLRAEMGCLVSVSTCSAPLAEKPNSAFRIQIFEEKIDGD